MSGLVKRRGWRLGVFAEQYFNALFRFAKGFLAFAR